MKKTGTIIMTLAVLFGLAETIYFGNNILPNSNAEKICDILVLILLFFGLYLHKNK